MGNKGTYVYEYERPAVSCDCVVLSKTESDVQVLLIKRGGEPYKNCWAFPGGFLEMDETMEQCAIRELKEETGIVAENIHFICIADTVHRDPRGRVISGIYATVIDKNNIFPIAADDAKEVAWFSVSNIPPLAFDHELLLHKVLKYFTIL